MIHHTMRSEMTFLLSVHYHLDFPHNFAPEICQNTEKPVKKNGMNYLFIGLTNVSMYIIAGILDQVLMLNLNKNHSI